LRDVVELDAAAVRIEQELPPALPDGQDGATVPGMVHDAEAPLPRERGGALEGPIAPERGGDTLATLGRLHLPGDGGTGQLAEGGQQVRAAHDGPVVHQAGRGRGGPTDEERHAYAAFVEAALAPAQGPRADDTRPGGVGDLDVLGPVIGAEDHDRV